VAIEAAELLAMELQRGANSVLLVPAVLVLAIPVLPSLWKGVVAGALIASSFWMTSVFASMQREWRCMLCSRLAHHRGGSTSTGSSTGA